MNHLIHTITRLCCKGEDRTNISEGKSDDLAIVETMKKSFKLEKNKRGYVISHINNTAVKVMMQILAGKLMRKCRVDEMPMLVVALVE